ncbi:MAG TPA: dockerin type I domain-containing protein [Isosphaeraceae bacterium]|nr:dockerin type I domain-containing protein [Isosphaeraceae bacterium]
MSTRRRSVRPVLDTLETRLALSTITPPLPSADTIGAQLVPLQPHQISSANLPIHQENLNPVKHSTLIRLAGDPVPGSTVNPRFVGATNANGRPLRFIQGGHYVPGIRPHAQAFAFVHNTNGMNALTTTTTDTSGNAVVSNSLPGDINGDGNVNPTDLALMQAAWLTTPGDAFYNPGADLNHNGYIGLGDVKLLERNMTPITPKIPLKVDLHLAKGQTALHPGISDSGAITNQLHVTVLGHTTPRSVVIADSGLGDYTYTGAMTYANDRGNFAYNFNLNPEDQLKNTEYLVIDPYGQQTIRAFPILYVQYNKPNY